MYTVCTMYATALNLFMSSLWLLTYKLSTINVSGHMSHDMGANLRQGVDPHSSRIAKFMPLVYNKHHHDSHH